MRLHKSLIISALLLLTFACKEVLEPTPVDLLTSDVALNEPSDVEPVRNGMYGALRGTASPTVILGDFTADMLTFNGTFGQYLELGSKQITASNGAVSALWGSLYQTIYIANFIIERLPEVPGVPAKQRAEVLAEAHFIRGYCYFIATYSFGGVPLVTTTEVSANRNIARSSPEDILRLVLEDYQFALDKVPAEPANAGFVGTQTVKAALARYYLYTQQWALAEQMATEVIASGKYTLVPNYADLVTKDFTSEAILEMGYTLSDDPGTSATGLNNLFVGRREIIPSNQAVVALYAAESGERRSSVSFNVQNLVGSDNGWSVSKYGTADEDNNNIVLFRLGEMYLIRAEARARQGKVTGANSAAEDVNVLRARAKATATSANTQAGMLLEIEQERLYELAFEGHRWYDLVRTGRISAIMSAFSPNWRSAYEKLPIPTSEIQNNPAIARDQNPGY